MNRSLKCLPEYPSAPCSSIFLYQSQEIGGEHKKQKTIYSKNAIDTTQAAQKIHYSCAAKSFPLTDFSLSKLSVILYFRPLFDSCHCFSPDITTRPYPGQCTRFCPRLPCSPHAVKQQTSICGPAYQKKRRPIQTPLPNNRIYA